MNTKPQKKNLVWLDLEMTGLDPKKCTILEIGVIITDEHLGVIEESASIPIHQSEKVLTSMELWSERHHKKSGLTEECRVSKIRLKQAEELALNLIKHHCVEKTAPLCGNTVWHDRRFLVKYMPRLESYLHYRIIDVSSIKEIVKRWYPVDYRMPRGKRKTHRVMDDIRESIEELKFYRQRIFVTDQRSK